MSAADLPPALREQAEALTDAWPLKAQQAAAAQLSRRYLAEQADGSPLIGSELDAAVYAGLRMPATYAACSACMRAVDALLPENEKPRSLLDVGAGTGAGAWAAADRWPLADAVCLERDPRMAAVGRRLTAPLGDRVRWEAADLTGGLGDRRADLVLASYMLNELKPADRAVSAAALWAAADGLLLLVEPGTPRGFACLREIRLQLLAAGAHMLYPCPHEAACPLPPEDWCHFTVRIARSRRQKLLKNADVPYEDEKFACLALSRRTVPLLQSRVLRHPAVAPGQITLRLCTGEGKLETKTVRKRDGDLFRQARKCGAGDGFAL